jgi:hypothetical protein
VFVALGGGAMLVFDRFVHSELYPWAALARRFPSRIPLLSANEPTVLDSSHVLDLKRDVAPRHPWSRREGCIQYLAPTSAGLELQAYWRYGLRTRRALVPWSEIRLLTQTPEGMSSTFELDLGGEVFLLVDVLAFHHIEPYLQSPSS